MKTRMQDSTLLNMMGANEEVIWQGKPDKTCFVLEAIFNPMLPMAFVWFLFDMTIISLFTLGIKNSTNTPVGLILFIVVFFGFHLMPVWLYLGGIIFTNLKYKNTEFLITNKGVYCSGGIFAKTYEHKPFAEISHCNIHRGIFDQIIGVGDVVLTSIHDGYNTRSQHSLYRGITICDIKDFQKVYSITKQLQADIYADTMYPNDLRPKENHGYQTQYKRDFE